MRRRGSRIQAQGEPTVRAKIARFATALTLGGLATAPAQAQFGPMPFPLIVVPPPAQNMVVPRPRTEPPKPAPEPRGSSTPHQLVCHYQGQTRVCE
jgi:hypothetical protein